jgi:ketosteroid isomerase-like protein
MADENKAVVRRLLEEVWGGGKLDVAEELIDPVAYRSHVPDVSDARMSHWTGANIVRVEVGAYRSAFPDLAVEVGALLSEGDAVAAYWSLTGTNTGTMRLTPMDGAVDEEVEPSGKELSASASTLFRLTGGRITEAAFGWHPLGLLDQVRLFATGSQVLDLGGGNRVSLVIPPD